MSDQGIRRIPVVGDTGQFLGALSVADVAKDHAFECDQCTANIMEIEARYA
jgi:hypothetical protein